MNFKKYLIALSLVAITSNLNLEARCKKDSCKKCTKTQKVAETNKCSNPNCKCTDCKCGADCKCN